MCPIEQRVSLITLGVADLARSRSFYEQLGWRGQEVEETVLFQASGQAIALWSREKLAADAGIEDDDTSTFGGVVLAHDVSSRSEVERVNAAAARADGRVTKEPAETFYGDLSACSETLMVMHGRSLTTLVCRSASTDH